MKNTFLLVFLVSCLTGCAPEQAKGKFHVKIVEELDSEFREYLTHNRVNFLNEENGLAIDYYDTKVGEAVSLVLNFYENLGLADDNLIVNFDGDIAYCCFLDSNQLAYIELYHGHEVLEQIKHLIEETIFKYPLRMSCEGCKVSTNIDDDAISIIYEGTTTATEQEEIHKGLGLNPEYEFMSNTSIRRLSLIGIVSAEFDSSPFVREYLENHLIVKFVP